MNTAIKGKGDEAEGDGEVHEELQDAAPPPSQEAAQAKAEGEAEGEAKTTEDAPSGL